MKGRELRRILERLGYTTTRQSGSHRRMVCAGKAPITFAFDDGDTVAPGLVRKVLSKEAGLSDEEVEAVLFP